MAAKHSERVTNQSGTDHDEVMSHACVIVSRYRTAGTVGPRKTEPMHVPLCTGTRHTHTSNKPHWLPLPKKTCENTRRRREKRRHGKNFRETLREGQEKARKAISRRVAIVDTHTVSASCGKRLRHQALAHAGPRRLPAGQARTKPVPAQ